MLPQLNTKFALVVIAGLSAANVYELTRPTEADKCVDMYLQSWKNSKVTMTVSNANINEACEQTTSSKVSMLRRHDFSNFTFGK